MDTNDPFATTTTTPTAERPLLGLTALVVEDSRFACEAMRLLCLRSGARIRRADCLRSARRHLRVYRPSIIMVDLGLPDGNGLDLIREMADSQPKVEVVLGMSGQPELEQQALDAGAAGFLAKPITSLAVFQEAILSLLPARRQPAGPRVLNREQISPDKIAYQDDMAHIANLLDDPPDDHALDYVAQFLSSVARSAQDSRLEQAAEALAKRRTNGQPAGSETAIIAGILQRRLTKKIAI